MKTKQEIIARIENPGLAQMCREMNCGPHTPLGMWPASLSHHHAYAGGLWAHTLEVAAIALALHDSGELRVRWLDAVLVACLWHDTAKVDEYVLVKPEEVEEGKRFLKSGLGNLVWTKDRAIKDGEHPHIQRSADCFMFAYPRGKVQVEIVELIHSCILSHHGRVEWGSPFEPQSAEAELVHYADMMSARIGRTK